jgi:uncharacterized protein (TIGR02246 family)
MIKTTFPAILCLAASGALAVPALAQTTVPNCAPVSEEQVAGLFNWFNEAWASQDPAKVTALFTRDAVLLATVSNSPRTTPAGVNDYFVTFLRNAPVGKIDTSTIKLGCNVASRVGTWTVSLRDAQSGQRSDVKARYSFIYKLEDGEWKIDHLHSSRMPEPSA